jgi:N-acetylglucosaminylphosphatidylinositol deacetylase
VMTLLTITKISLLILNLGIFVLIVYMQKRKYTQETIDLLFDDDDSDEKKKKKKNRRIGIVIAHPDDEAMFMTPTITSITNLVKEKKIEDQVYLLCLSTGDADGLGDIRVTELGNSCKKLGILNNDENVTLIQEVSQLNKQSRVTIVDHKDLKDGMKRKWSHELIRQCVDQFIQLNQLDTILTFDEHGISSHPNHIDVHCGVCLTKEDVIIYTLTTSNIFRKYISVFDYLISIVCDKKKDNDVILFTPSQFNAYHTMESHASQFVWFRRLFILFSRYAYVNSWNRYNTKQ